MYVTMLKGKAIETIELTSSSYTVGETAGHTFTFTSNIPMELTDTLMIVYPPETFPPLKGEDNC